MRRVKIGIIGYGGLGRSMVKLLDIKRQTLREQEELDLVLTCVLGRNGGIYSHGSCDGLDCSGLVRLSESGTAKRLENIPGFDPDFNFEKMLSAKPDVVAEFTPTNKTTGEPGLSHIRECFKHNIHVVTGNKGPVLLAWEELANLARERDLLFGISCTTGGALPTLLNGIDAMAGSDILSIEGVLNGTTNFILDRMEDGKSYAEALKEAQAVGIAEANPAQDVEGWDTAIKLLIIARIAMRARLGLENVHVQGITHLTPDDIKLARDSGKRIKLVGRARRENSGEIVCEVAPIPVSTENPLYNVCGKNKAVRYVSDTMGELFISGGASDPIAAAAASLRDIVNAHRAGLLNSR